MSADDDAPLKDVLPGPGLASTAHRMRDKWLHGREAVWVVMHLPSELWWRPKRAGYTAELVAAGVYTQAEAESCARMRGEDKAVPLAEALKGLADGTVGAAFGMQPKPRISGDS